MYVSSWHHLPPYFFFSKNQKTLLRYYPFTHPRKHYFYYARGGIYHVAKKLNQLGLKRVLFPAYHHGNEVKAMLAGGVGLTYYNIIDNGQIDFDDLERRITADTRVLYIIHYNGFAQNMERVMELVSTYNLYLIEDVALSMFSKYGDKYLGEFGDISIFCLYKTFAIPNGGLIVVNNPELDITPQTRPPDRVSTISRLVGLFIYWMDNRFDGLGQKVQRVKTTVGEMFAKMNLEPTAVMDSVFDESKVNWGISRLSKFLINHSKVDDIIALRRRNYQYYLDRLAADPMTIDVLFPELNEGAVPFVMLAMVKNRDKIFERLLEKGIEASRFWRVWHPDVPKHEFPYVDRLREEVLELPVHQSVTLKQIDMVVEHLRTIIQEVNPGIKARKSTVFSRFG
ncbi:MAG: hypothetical protein D6748_15805 [Calditrichaeota bacterium]|nr:MAG: hypothetical protein D6748_15805 [Calditrichota bacterium]